MTALVANTAPSRWWRSRTVRRFTSHHLALLGVAMITLLTLACVFGPRAAGVVFALPALALAGLLLARRGERAAH